MIKYKPVMPSSILQERTSEDFNYSQKISNNVSLKVGVVVDIIELGDKKNVSKVTTEYNVMVIEDQSNSVYANCMAVDGFGGIGDFLNKKLRKTKDPTKVSSRTTLTNQNGSIVLLLCIDGHSEQAVIVGSLAHPDRKNGQLTKDKGHHLEGEFNGINWQIDKNGALKVTFKSASDNDGKYKESEGKVGGTHLHMDKDGGVDINTNLKGAEETYIRMDKKNKDVGLKAGQHIGLTAEKNIGLTAKANITSKATADLLAEAGGSMTLKSAGAFGINAGAALNVQAASVDIVSNGSVKINGTMVQLSAPSIQLGNGGTPAVTMSTQFIGIGNLGGPVISTAIGPFSSSVLIAP